jgi:hypothetical protein
MKSLGHAATTIVLAVATAYTTTRFLQPSVHLRFEPQAPMVTPATQRGNGNDLYAIKVETNATLKNAIARLLIISKSPDLSNPLNTVVEPAFGWPLGADSFQPRTIGIADYIIVAFGTKSPDGQIHIGFFFNEFYGHAGLESKPMVELDFLKDLEPGTYYMQIGLLADDTMPVKQKFKID